jgi:hypothetical protein
MSLEREVEEIEATLSKAGVPLDVVLAKADVNRSTWTRWKNGTVKGARYDTWSKVKEAAAEAVGAAA